ncbi:MAG: NUDIX domain-containing protein [Nanoarchaeota archaeon]|nr:NUDIX domain-containing protein [Nanoarchaeota archaeon]
MKTDLTVNGFLIHDHKLLLIHHKKLDLWLAPGGHLDQNETPDQALIREYKEEVNLDIEVLNQKPVDHGGNIRKHMAVPFYVNIHEAGDHDHYCLFYLCKTNNPKNIKINKDEIKDFKWLSKEELNQDHIPKDVQNIALIAFKTLNCLKSLKNF